MNASNERRNDPENFGARITRFGVVVEKLWNFEVSGLFLRERKEKVVDSVHGPWTTAVRPGAWRHAHRSSASSHSSSPVLGSDSGGGGVGHGGLSPGFTGAREAVERRRDGGEGGCGGALGAGSHGTGREGKEGQGGVVRRGGVRMPFYMVRGGAGVTPTFYENKILST
jgi:hypothetical protein